MTPRLCLRSKKVLVLGDETRILLPAVRSLGREGAEVHIAWCPISEPVHSSRFVRRSYCGPGHVRAESNWFDQLSELQEQERFDLILPLTEHAGFLFHQDRAAWESRLPVAIASAQAMEIGLDKIQSWMLAKSLGIPVPAAIDLTAQDGDVDLQHIGSLNYPFVLKPLCSVTGGAAEEKNFVQLITSEHQLREVVAKSPGVQYQIQEYVEGNGIGVEFLARDGEMLYSFQHKRLHETTGYGSTYRESMHPTAYLVEAARKILRALNYTGIGMLEFRVDERSDRWVFIELNPRYWGSLPLSVAAGADFPLYHVLMELGMPLELPSEYSLGVRSRNLLNDMRWMWRSCTMGNAVSSATGHDGWRINQVSRWQLVKDFARLITFQDHSDTHAYNDPGPSLKELWLLVGQCMRRLRVRPEF